MQGKKQYAEKLFTTFQLSAHVPQDNFYRRLKDLLDLQWLYKGTKEYYGSEGQKSIDPVVFLKLMLIGYLENLGSDRRIIRTVSMRLDMLYFIGYDIDEELPWHSTLSRRRQAMDSAPVKANASMDSLKEKEILDDVSEYLGELRSEEENNNDDGGGVGNTNNTVSAERNKAVQLHHKWKEKAYKGMPGGDSKGRAKFVSNHTHYSTTDPDARVSVKPGKPRQLNYLAQVSVDTAHHVITQIQTDYADKKDSQCLPSLLTNTIHNLSEHGIEIEEVYADTGYSSGEALKALEENNITG